MTSAQRPRPAVAGCGSIVDDEADAQRDAEAVGDVEAGRVIPNDDVCTWLETWGTPDEKPAPEAWFK